MHTLILKKFYYEDINGFLLYTLSYTYFAVCSNWTKFNKELVNPKNIFLKNCCLILENMWLCQTKLALAGEECLL